MIKIIRSHNCHLKNGNPIYGKMVKLKQGPGASGEGHHKINSKTPGKFELNFRYVIFKRILVIDGCGISCELALIWMPLDFTDDQSILVQVMAWCRQATSHYLSRW